MLKMNEIKDWDKGTITKKIEGLRAELFNYRMQKAASGLEKPHRIKEAKKDIARLMTVLNAKGEK